MMKLDKYEAKKNRWRIPEKTLFILAMIGGSLGVYLGMYTFHHKTKKWYFVIGIPMIFIIQIVLFVFIKYF